MCRAWGTRDLVAVLWPEPRHLWQPSTNWVGILPAPGGKAGSSLPAPTSHGGRPAAGPLGAPRPLPGLAECVASYVPVPVHGTGSI